MKTRLPTDRNDPGNRTYTVNIGAVTLDVTVNLLDGKPMELFGKATHGHQGQVDALCTLASSSLQYGCPAAKVVELLRFRRYDPQGGIGEPSSLADAIGRVLGKYVEETE